MTDKLMKLLELSPVTVYFTENITFNCAGSFYHRKPIGYLPHIRVRSKLKADKKIVVLVHEIGHAICYNTDCKCMKNSDRALQEIHAFKFQLDWLLKHKQKESLQIAIDIIEKCLDRNDYYVKAVKYIMKLKLWQKCVKYAKE